MSLNDLADQIVKKQLMMVDQQVELAVENERLKLRLDLMVEWLEKIERLASVAPKRGASAPDLNAIHYCSSQALKELQELKKMGPSMRVLPKPTLDPPQP